MYDAPTPGTAVKVQLSIPSRSENFTTPFLAYVVAGPVYQGFKGLVMIPPIEDVPEYLMMLHVLDIVSHA